MKLFLIFALLSFPYMVFGQEDSLFPELSKLSSSDHKESDKLPQNTITIPQNENFEEDSLDENSETVIQEDSLFEPDINSSTTDDEAKREKEGEGEEENDDEDKEQHTYLFIDNAKATLTPIRNASFCTADFIAANKLKKELKQISGTFTIGEMQKNFIFNNIPVNTAAGAHYTFVGTSCEQILNAPKVEVNTCQVDGWSEKKCLDKIMFLAIPKQDVMPE